jgi:hypothetical protein
MSGEESPSVGDLGFGLWLQERYDEARAEYERLQSISDSMTAEVERRRALGEEAADLMTETVTVLAALSPAMSALYDAKTAIEVFNREYEAKRPIPERNEPDPNIAEWVDILDHRELAAMLEVERLRKELDESQSAHDAAYDAATDVDEKLAILSSRTPLILAYEAAFKEQQSASDDLDRAMREAYPDEFEDRPGS